MLTQIGQHCRHGVVTAGPSRPLRDTMATRYRLRAAVPAKWVLGAMAAGLTGILRPPRLSSGLCDWRWRPARSRTPATNCPIQRAVKPEPFRVAKAASGLFITWGYTELCLYVVMLETGHVGISVLLDEVRRSTSTQNRNQQRLDKYILVSYEGKGIAIL